MLFRTCVIIIIKHINTSPKSVEVIPNQPLSLAVAEVQVFTGSILQVHRPAIMLSNKAEQPCPRVLPNCCPLGGGDHNLVTARFTGQGLQKVTHSWVVLLVEQCAVRLAHVAFMARYGPSFAGYAFTSVWIFFHRHILTNTL